MSTTDRPGPSFLYVCHRVCRLEVDRLRGAAPFPPHTVRVRDLEIINDISVGSNTMVALRFILLVLIPNPILGVLSFVRFA